MQLFYIYLQVMTIVIMNNHNHNPSLYTLYIYNSPLKFGKHSKLGDIDGKIISPALSLLYHFLLSIPWFPLLLSLCTTKRWNPPYSRAAILKKGFILGDTPTRGITRYHLSYFMQKNVYFLESVVVEK